MEMLIYIFLPAFLAGLVQGITGFGAGIVIMMFYPLIFSVTESTCIGGVICVTHCMLMVYHYRKYVNVKKVIVPFLIFNCFSSVCILIAKGLDQTLMKIILGCFLMLLSVYFLFFSKKDFKPKGIVAYICIAISGICGGLFGVGGPLLVMYYLSITNSKEEYLGTIQCLFLFNTIYTTTFRILNGILQPNMFPLILIGILAIQLGGIIANKVVNKLNPEVIRKITYGFIGIAGLYNVLVNIL